MTYTIICKKYHQPIRSENKDLPAYLLVDYKQIQPLMDLPVVVLAITSKNT